ncbi:GPP34 family phosphoprotein [Microbacterium insulae]|uniref:GPP34 family phosphoprotein n=1 Tax=Microbacterium insulae TaxID=483014 RepID=A0ABW3AF73_9MICO
MNADPERRSAEPLLVEDVLLTLFQPSSHTIAGENTLFYVLGAAVLADLSREGRLSVTEGRLSATLEAAGDPPTDPLLEPAWSYMATKPRDVQTVLAAVGPELRGRVIERLVERGHLREEEHRALGIFATTRLALASDRREQLMDGVKAVLLDGKEPDDRTATIIALISASGTLPQFDGEIPWGSAVQSRAAQIEHGEWGAVAAASAVTRTMMAVLANAVIAATVLPRG